MSNDKRNPFERASKDRPKADPSTATMPPSQRMTKARTGGNVSGESRESHNPNWRPSRPEDRLVAQNAPPTTAAAPRTRVNGVLETADLTEARLAEQKRRAAVKENAAGLAQRTEFVPEDFQAVFAGWMLVHAIEVGGSFELTEWNAVQLTRCVYWQVMSGQPGFDRFGISQLTAAHEWLAANGYYDSRTQKRAVHPGIGRAAKEFPVWEEQTQPSEPLRTGNRPVYVRRDEISDAEARTLSFDELKKRAQSQFKPETR
ncbi:MAG TPA: hypothetical protein VNV41_07210 [Candidatus Acidoferrales bacterium]|jgi:hypothetical protein|nr:hypothetical protein [Candidatus Acidoferrales bacterium]